MIRSRFRLFCSILLAAVFGLLLVPLGAAAAPTPAANPTIVSFTFDDTLISQAAAVKVLDEYGMNGTLYVNSTRIGKDSDFLSLKNLKEYEALGFEIGGHTLDHGDLTTLTPTELKHQICDDRATLLDMGFKPTSFAYPLGATNRQVEQVVQGCGYNSARSLPGLRSMGYGCKAECPPAESIPPANIWGIRTPTTIRPSTTVAMMQQYVTQAEAGGGGWVPLVFHHICISNCETQTDAANNSITLPEFTEFVKWLAQHRGPNVKVQTVQQVIGGPVKPSVGTVQPHATDESTPTPVPVQQNPSNTNTNVDDRYAFTLGGLGVGQGFVIALGIVLAIAGILTYRIRTRSEKYVSSNPGKA